MTIHFRSRFGIALTAILFYSPAFSDDCEFGDVFQNWSYEGAELIVCTFGTLRKDEPEATWTGSGIELRFRSGDEVSTLEMWTEAEPEVTFSYSPGKLRVLTRMWSSHAESYVPFISSTYFSEAGSVRSESVLLAKAIAYEESEADRLVVLIVESYSKSECYDEVLNAMYTIRDMGIHEPDKAISKLEDIRPKIVSSAALSEYLSSIVNELKDVSALRT